MKCVVIVRRGWPETANTWEPLENLQSVPDLVDAFEDRYATFYFPSMQKKKKIKMKKLISSRF